MLPDVYEYITHVTNNAPPYTKTCADAFATLHAGFEKEWLLAALRMTKGKMTKASRLLRMNRNTLRKLCEKHGIDCAELKMQYMRYEYPHVINARLNENRL